MVLFTAALLLTQSTPPPDFAREVLPLLARKCLACHGNDEHTRAAGLRLDLREDATAPRDGFPALVPGDPDASELFVRITDTADPMPPKKAGEPLTPDEVDLLRRWIEAGAPYGVHWAFAPPVPTDVPLAPEPAWVRSPIDAFIATRLAAEGLTPSPDADPATLLRRVALDLTGLPPDPDEVRRFMRECAEGDPDAAYKSAVERLLASPHYGERWAAVWLDLARYADSAGHGSDPLRTIWRYRDWVIDAFDKNLPLDTFAKLQLAGDLLPEPTLDSRLATAFHRNTPTNTEGGTDDEEFRVLAVKDRVNTTGQVWLGLTVGCAECHSHKYDPLSQREYYQLFDFFNHTADTDQNDDRPRIPTPTPAQAEALARINAELEALDAELQRIEPDLAVGAARLRDREAAWHDHGTWTPEPGPDGVRTDVISLPLKDEVAALRIRALTDPSLPRSGPGQSPGNGNFVLTELRVEALFSAGESEVTALLPIVAANASHAQAGYGVGAAFDGAERSGWAIAPQQGVEHEAVFSLGPAAEAAAQGAPTGLRITLAQDYGSGHTLGRFQLATAAEGPAPRALTAGARRALQRDPAAWDDADRAALRAQLLHDDPAAVALQERRAALLAEKDALDVVTTPVMVEVPRERRRTTHVLHKGNFLEPGEVVTAETPAALHPFGERPRDRAGLADWLFDRANPLTARVTANRIWARLFGRGLVATEEDFGAQGALPSHPELLDWLALELVQLGWDQKQFLRRIVLSSTYRQAARVSPEQRERDPANVWLGSFPRQRLEAEMVRDVALSAAGLLSAKKFGPSVFPPQPPGLWQAAFNGERDWQESQGEDRWRRGLYVFLRRTTPYPMLQTFDAPSREVCTLKRPRTNTPLQAFVTLNDPVFIEAAEALGRRAAAAEVDTDGVALVLWRATQRPPTEADTAELTALLADARAAFAAEPEAAEALLAASRGALGPLPTELAALDVAAWTLVASVALNLDAALTKE